MPVNFFPLPTLLDQYPCTPFSCLSDSTIRSGVCPGQVACDNRSVAVDLHLHVLELQIKFLTCIYSGLEVVSALFKRIESLKESTTCKDAGF